MHKELEDRGGLGCQHGEIRRRGGGNDGLEIYINRQHHKGMGDEDGGKRSASPKEKRYEMENLEDHVLGCSWRSWARKMCTVLTYRIG
jgi:hypothetical protein